MSTYISHQAHSIPDLAASLTDEALELASEFGTRGDSVEMELTLWRTLAAELKRERGFIPRQDDATLQRVVNRAALRVVAEWSGFAHSRTPRTERATRHLSHA